MRVYDPEAMENVRAHYGDRLVYCQQRDDALRRGRRPGDLTEWKQFVHPDFDEMRRLMRQPVIFDGRNLYQSRADASRPASPTTASDGRRCNPWSAEACLRFLAF